MNAYCARKPSFISGYGFFVGEFSLRSYMRGELHPSELKSMKEFQQSKIIHSIQGKCN